jgi:hypothetical protein
MGCTLCDCPVLHSLGDGIGNIQRQGRAGGNAAFPGPVNITGQLLLHSSFVEYVGAEYFRDIQMFTHSTIPFKKQIGRQKMTDMNGK